MLNSLAPKGDEFLKLLRILIESKGELQRAFSAAPRGIRINFLNHLFNIPSPESYTALSILLKSAQPILQDDGVFDIVRKKHHSFLETHWMAPLPLPTETALKSEAPSEAAVAQAGERTPPMEERAGGVQETGASPKKKVCPLTLKAILEKNFKIDDMGTDDANALFTLLTEHKDPAQSDNAAYRLFCKVNEKMVGFLTNRFQKGEGIYDIMTPVIDKATGRNTGHVVPSGGFTALKSIIENAFQDSEDGVGKKLVTVKGTRGTGKIDLGGGKFRFRYIIMVSILHLSEKSGNSFKRTTLKKTKGLWEETDDSIRIRPGNQTSLLEALGVMKNGAYIQSPSNIILVVNGL